VPGDPLGGTAVVGDLVVTALLDGSVIAMRRDDGTIVKTWKTGGGVNGWLSTVDDLMLVPVGSTRTPSLLALGLPR
jgi:hypothetical protein